MDMIYNRCVKHQYLNLQDGHTFDVDYQIHVSFKHQFDKIVYTEELVEDQFII